MVNSLIEKGFVRKALPFLFILIIAVSFWPLSRAGYLNLDDAGHVLENRLVLDHSFAGIGRIFSSSDSVSAIYVPLTVLSFNIEHLLFGFTPFVSHFINLLLHVLIVFLIAQLGMAIGLGRGAAFLGALVFAIHPMHVEPVAWITSRKDGLSGLFYLLSLLSYIAYVKTANGRKYIFSLGCAALAVLAKPMALSLPFVLFLFDWFLKRPKGRAPWFDKVPFFIVVELLALVTYLQNSRSVPFLFPDSLLVWFWSASFYIEKFFWPAGLSPLYGAPSPVALSAFAYFKSLLIVACIVGAAVVFRSKRWVLFAVMFFVLTTFFLWRFDVYDMTIVADRFMYIPSMGFCLLCGWAAAALWKPFPLYRRILSVGLVALLFTLGLMTFQQARVWKNSWTVWSRAVRSVPPAQSAFIGRIRGITDPGNYFEDADDIVRYVSLEKLAQGAAVPEAVVRSKLKYFRALIVIHDFKCVSDPASIKMLSYNLALMYKDIGHPRAKEVMAQALRLNPWLSSYFFNKALAAFLGGNYGAAKDYVNNSLEMAPNDAGALVLREVVNKKMGE